MQCEKEVQARREAEARSERLETELGTLRDVVTAALVRSGMALPGNSVAAVLAEQTGNEGTAAAPTQPTGVGRFAGAGNPRVCSRGPSLRGGSFIESAVALAAAAPAASIAAFAAFV